MNKSIEDSARESTVCVCQRERERQHQCTTCCHGDVTDRQLQRVRHFVKADGFVHVLKQSVINLFHLFNITSNVRLNRQKNSSDWIPALSHDVRIFL